MSQAIGHIVYGVRCTREMREKAAERAELERLTKKYNPA